MVITAYRGIWGREGAKGMKHHEVIIDFSRRGLLEAFRRLISRKRPDQRAMTIADDLSQVSGLSALMIQRSFSSP